MAGIIYDKYNLGQSESKIINSVAQEISIDLSLEPNTHSPHFGKVYGNVLTSDNTPIEKALIELMSPEYVPVMYTFTDSMGKYLFINVQPSSYTIFATAPGFKTQEGMKFNISKLQEIERNFILDRQSEISRGIIAGDLLDFASNNGIGGAVISLFKGTKPTPKSLIAISYTNEYGQFTFRDLPKGNYVVQAKALGYSLITVDTSIITDGQIVSMKLVALINNIYQGTVSGIITDSTNYPLSNADVILYRVNSSSQNNTKLLDSFSLLNFSSSSNESLTPIAFTKTTDRGVYLFANVPPGTYIVKANQLEITKITI